MKWATKTINWSRIWVTAFSWTSERLARWVSVLELYIEDENEWDFEAPASVEPLWGAWPAENQICATKCHIIFQVIKTYWTRSIGRTLMLNSNCNFVPSAPFRYKFSLSHGRQTYFVTVFHFPKAPSAIFRENYLFSWLPGIFETKFDLLRTINVNFGHFFRFSMASRSICKLLLLFQAYFEGISTLSAQCFSEFLAWNWFSSDFLPSPWLSVPILAFFLALSTDLR